MYLILILPHSIGIVSGLYNILQGHIHKGRFPVESRDALTSRHDTYGSIIKFQHVILLRMVVINRLGSKHRPLFFLKIS